MNTPVIQANDLAKTFRNGVIAVSGLDLAIQRGTVYGLIGRNGAGKTTSLRLLMGLLHPDRGNCRVLGHDLRLAGPEVRSRVAYVSQEQQLPPGSSLRELCAQVSSFHERWDHELARRLGVLFQLSPDVPMGVLSGGEQRKAAILLAFASCPEVLILDEPAAGLDPIARRQLIGQIVEHLGEGGERTVLFSTHIIEDIERVADQVGIMDRGRLVAGGRVEELQSGLRRVQIIFDGAGVPPGFRLNGALRVKVEGAVVTAVLDVSRPGSLEELRAIPGARVHDFPLGLQDLFIELLDRDPAAPTLISQPFDPHELPRQIHAFHVSHFSGSAAKAPRPGIPGPTRRVDGIVPRLAGGTVGAGAVQSSGMVAGLGIGVCGDGCSGAGRGRCD